MLLLYAYCAGIVSSRKIERACYEDLAFRVLTGNQQPDHSRISEFRRRNLEALSGLFVQILRFWQEAGMVSLGHVALDGTKVQANASKHKAMSHERMLKAEAQLEKEIKELMRKAEILDAQEDGKYGKGKLGSDLPKELQRRQDRLEKISQTRKAPGVGDGLRAAVGPWGPPARALRCSAQAGQQQEHRPTGLTPGVDEKIPAPWQRTGPGWLTFRCRLPLPWQGEDPG